MPNLESITKAHHCAAMLLSDLQELLHGSDAVAALLVLPMISEAAKLRDSLGALESAVQESQ
jgi:hypothetical protein